MKILALDVGGTAVKSAIIDRDNQICDIRVSPSSPAPAPDLVRHAVRVAKEYVDYDVLAVSMTGQIDHLTQTVRFRSDVGDGSKVEYPVGEILHDAVQHPVFVINDSNAAALAEGCFGAGRGWRDFLCLTYGTGVGGGIVLDRKLLTGRSGIAGEVGHMVTHAGGLPCKCGHGGCYQQYASVTALVQQARELVPDLENARQLFDRLAALPELQRVVDEWIGEIVEGRASLAYTFDPECFVLGGGVMEREDVLTQIRSRFAERVMQSFSKVQIVQAQLGNRAGMFGAAAYARWALEHPEDCSRIGCFMGEQINPNRTGE